MPHALKNIKIVLPLSKYVFDKLQNGVPCSPAYLYALFESDYYGILSQNLSNRY